jgi:transposase
MSDHKGARLVLDALPTAKVLIADRGYDSAPFRHALCAKGIEPCIPSSRSRKIPFAYDPTLYRQRHKIKNMFAKLKDWRRIATRYDRCAHTFFSAICLGRITAALSLPPKRSRTRTLRQGSLPNVGAQIEQVRPWPAALSHEASRGHFGTGPSRHEPLKSHDPIVIEGAVEASKSALI